MKLIKREKRITIPQFCSVFTNREFRTRDRLLRNIVMVEDIDGNYRIEERFSLLGMLSFIMLLAVVAVCTLITRGLYGLIDLYSEEITPFIKGEPLRVDECKHNIKSTAQLLEFTGWY